MPGISLELIQTVALGPFNPHIIEPNWLYRQKLCDEKALRAIEFLPGAAGEEEVFRLGRCEWQVDYGRLSVAVRRPDPKLPDDPGEKVAEVIKLLSHTPVRAVGHNFHFSHDLAQWGTRPRPQLGPAEVVPVAAGISPAMTKWTGSYSGQDVWIEVTAEVDPTGGPIVLLVNHTRATDATDFTTAAAAARKLLDDARMTGRLLADLFQVEWAP